MLFSVSCDVLTFLRIQSGESGREKEKVEGKERTVVICGNLLWISISLTSGLLVDLV